MRAPLCYARGMASFLRRLSALLAATLATVASACPQCAGRDDGAGGRTVLVVAAMISVPFLLAGVVAVCVRRLGE